MAKPFIDSGEVIAPSTAMTAAGLPLVLEQCLRHAPACIALVMGREHVFAFVNDAYAAFIGQQAAELKGRPAFEVLSGVRGQGFEELLEQLWATREPYVGKGVAVRLGHRPGARELYADMLLQPVFDEAGDMVGIFFQWHDVTERHLLAEAQRQATKNQDLFLSKLVHELRTPLAAIRSAVEVLSHLPGLREPRAERMSRVIRHQASSVGALVDELADIASVKLGRTVLAVQDGVLLQDVVRQSVDACANRFADKQQSIGLCLPERPVRLSADALKLGRVMCNLLTNASKYTPQGGRIEVELVCSREGAVLSVSDSGIGLKRDAQQRVFDLFFQEEGGSASRQGGLGIGLALVKQIVELHGGTVEAHSDGPGLGSTFVVRLPGARGEKGRT
jgi:PAS domain S-box-containing protein